jgi:hypothetical protein
VIELSGVGTLDVEAGHNIGPLTSQADILNAGAQNEGSADRYRNHWQRAQPLSAARWRQHRCVLFGVGPGIETSNFLTQYLSNPNGVDGFGSLLPDLVTFTEQQEDGQGGRYRFRPGSAQRGVDSRQQAEVRLPAIAHLCTSRQCSCSRSSSSCWPKVGVDYNDPSSPYYHQYVRGYAAI